VRRLLRDPSFLSTYESARREALGVALTALQAASAEAVGALRENLQAGTPAAIRVKAAVALLDLALRSAELCDVRARVTALEEQLAREQEDGDAYEMGAAAAEARSRVARPW